ncbi:MAG TPA: hypothetical protein VLH56_18180 [Dissulfurispiraceae bacterium]|nr:hypothetical protein [Dissulfurispiraceae bacterium]
MAHPLRTLTIDDWLDGGLSYYQYENDKKRKRLKTLGHGCRNNPVKIIWDSLRPDRKALLGRPAGDASTARGNEVEQALEHDAGAYNYYASYMKPDGTPLSPEKSKTYYATACVLNAIIKVYAGREAFRARVGKRTTTADLDRIVAKALAIDREKWPFDLPESKRVKDKLKEYKEKGYESLIKRYDGNQNRRKVHEGIEGLLISIYCMSNLPFGEWVYEDYNAFVEGKKDIVDRESGEVLDPQDYYDATGYPVHLERSTVRHYFYKNKALVDSVRKNRIDFITQNSPHNSRRRPDYSLSKISMDDRTLPRRTPEGDMVNVYFAVEVLSGAWLGYTHKRGALTVEDVRECFRNMYGTLQRHSLVWPGECEVEHHLMGSIKDELEMMFMEATFCAPGLSRSKRAEQGVRAKKYEDEKRHQTGIGRWYGKGAYKTKSANKDAEYKEERLPYAQLIAEDIESINRHNHALHPDQKRWPGKTRWQVLSENQNPGLAPAQAHLIMRYVGQKTETSITNNTYVKVQYSRYTIESYGMLKRLKPNNYNVEARWLRDADGSIDELYLYQDDKYIGKALKELVYNEAKIERTEADEAIRTEQAKRQARFHKEIKDEKARKYRKVAVLPGDVNYHQDLIPEVLDVSPYQADADPADDPLATYDPEYWVQKALRDR